MKLWRVNYQYTVVNDIYIEAPDAETVEEAFTHRWNEGDFLTQEEFEKGSIEGLHIAVEAE